MKAAELQCKVKSFRMLTPTVFELTFDTTPVLDFIAGQFVSVIIPGAGPEGRDLRRAYSIASKPGLTSIELCIKLVEGGPGTQYLYKLRPGDSFRVVAPYGDFVYKTNTGKHACFIATGTGISPFRSMLMSEHFKANSPASATCMLGVRTEDELLYSECFDALDHVKFIRAVSQPSPSWKGFSGRVTHYLKGLANDFPWLNTDYYLCGHGGMISEVKEFLAEKGVVKESIHQEIYYK